MVLESKIENEIKYLYFNDEASLNAISSGDWKSLKSEIESFEKSDQKYLVIKHINGCLLYTSPSPRDRQKSRMPSSA